jgi:hypothetical protein
MATVHPIRSQPEDEAPFDLHARAMDNLRFIRETMERAGSFTAVSGWGMVGMGVTAFAAAWVSSRQASPEGWLTVWWAEALFAMAIGGWTTARKARAAKMPLLSGPGRKFALSLAPPLAAGGLLTAFLYDTGLVAALPGMWLLLFGTGVVTAGAFSARVVPVMGMCFMALGTAALFTPAGWGSAMMALGFGGLNVLFGAIIAWRYGG